jgi:hypothetical protein
VRPADDHYRNLLMRISDLAVTDDFIDGITFENCQIVGPAVLLPLENCTFRSNTFEGDEEAILWELRPPRTRVLGVIALRSCVFVGCRFTRIGIAGPPELIAQFRGGSATN